MKPEDLTIAAIEEDGTLRIEVDNGNGTGHLRWYEEINSDIN